MSVNLSSVGPSVHPSLHLNSTVTRESKLPLFSPPPLDEGAPTSPSFLQRFTPSNVLDENAEEEEITSSADTYSIDEHVVKDYLVAVAEADRAQNSVTKLGYLVTGAAILGFAVVIFRNMGLSSQNDHLDTLLKQCQNQPLNYPQQPDLPPLMAPVTERIREYFCGSANCPDYASTIHGVASQCLEVPYSFAGGVPLGAQQRCIKEFYLHQGEADRQSSVIQYSISHLPMQIYNGTTPLYNHLSLTCHLNHSQNNGTSYLSTLCNGVLATGASYHDSLTGQGFCDYSKRNIFHYQSNLNSIQNPLNELSGTFQEALFDCGGNVENNNLDSITPNKLYALMSKIAYRATQEIGV